MGQDLIHNPRYLYYSTEQGLSQNSITQIIQDSLGFMWMATQDGLNKFDGQHFEHFTKQRGDSTSINANWINCLYIDSHQNLWVGTTQGLNKYRATTNNFERFSPPTIDNTTQRKYSITAIFEDSEHQLWVGTRHHGFFLLNQENKTFERALQNEAIHNKSHVLGFTEDQQQNLWVITAKQLYKWDKTAKHIDQAIPNLSVRFTSWNAIGKNKLWLGSDNNGVIEFSFADKTFDKKPLPSSMHRSYILGICHDSQQQIWAGTERGLHVFNTVTEKWTAIETEKDGKSGLRGTIISAVYEDIAGGIWIGTRNVGLNYLSSMNRSNFNSHYSLNGELSENSVLALLQDHQGNIWVGTDGDGLKVIDSSTNQIKTYQKNGKNHIPSDVILSIYQDHQNRIWLGTYKGGLLLWNPRSDSFKQYLHSENDTTSISGNTIWTIYEDHLHNLWAGTSTAGLNLLNPDQKTFKHFLPNPDNQNAINYIDIRVITQDHTQNLLVGSFGGGLSVMSYDSFGKFKSYSYDPEDTNSISSNNVISIYEDTKNRLWLGTYGGGLAQFHRESETFTSLQTEHGLPSNQIYAITEDSTHHFWISTPKGFFKFNPENRSWKVFDWYNELFEHEFNRNSCIQKNDGEIIFGNYKGLVSFYPHQIRQNTYVPPIVLTDFQLFNQAVPIGPNSPLKSHINLAQEIVLDWHQNMFSINFAALSYTNPKKNQYQYMLENFDEAWRNSGTTTSMTYTNLDPGKYTLIIKGSNNDLLWNQQGRRLSIVITPPWYKTRLARILFVLFIVGSTYLAYRWRTAQLRHKKKELERLVSERTSELQEANGSLQRQKEEITVQNEELTQQAEEIATQRDQIEVQHKALEQSYNDISIVSEAGKNITGSFSLDLIISKVYTEVNQMLHAPTFAIGVYHAEEKSLLFTEIDGQGNEISTSKDSLSQEHLLSIQCFNESKTILINHFSDQYPNSTPASGEYAESIIYIPLISKGKKVGVITAQSPEKYQYKERHVTLLESLASYAATALDNSMAYDIINNKNKLIMDSIRYAKTIQEAILPRSTRLEAAFEDHFVLFNPKDIVSGDFYWYLPVSDTADKVIHYIAVVDCTGHGVPGAFMSMIGSRILTEVLIEKGKRIPSAILEEVNLEIVTALKQDNNNKQANNDGMDLSICRIEHLADGSSKVEFASAKSSVYCYNGTSKQLNRFKGDNRSIGGFQRHKPPFTDHLLHLNKGDKLYMATDGYADQNGLAHKKIGTKKFASLLEQSATLSMQQQQALLEENLKEHQQGLEQRDDITVIGIQF